MPYSSSLLFEWPNAKEVIFPIRDGVMIGAMSGAKLSTVVVVLATLEMVVHSNCLGAAAKSSQNWGSIKCGPSCVRRMSNWRLAPHFSSGVVVASSRWHAAASVRVA